MGFFFCFFQGATHSSFGLCIGSSAHFHPLCTYLTPIHLWSPCLAWLSPFPDLERSQGSPSAVRVPALPSHNNHQVVVPKFLLLLSCQTEGSLRVETLTLLFTPSVPNLAMCLAHSQDLANHCRNKNQIQLKVYFNYTN
jgi:hypothetical protein